MSTLDATDASAPPTPKRRIPRVAIAIAALAVIVGAVVVFNATRTTPLQAAWDTVHATLSQQHEIDVFEQYATIGDDGRSLILDGEGTEEDGLTITELAGILLEVNAPDSVIARIDGTRALDGRQTAEWDGFAASWTYHPESGLDIILEERP